MLKNLCLKENYKSVFPKIDLCGDNAAMIAWATILKYKNSHGLNFKPNPRLSI